MTAPLGERRRDLRQQLAAQRERLALQLAAGGAAGDGYPRSITMRWLIREPELMVRLLKKVLGRRVGGALPTVLALSRFLRATAPKKIDQQGPMRSP